MNDLSEARDRIKNLADLAEVVRRDGVHLTGGPNEFKGLCPFHKEKSPSFTVFNKDGGWAFHCFGCGVNGDVFEWVMRQKGLSFPNALALLANEFGVVLPEAEKRLYQPREVRREKNSPPRGPFNPDDYRALTPGSPAFEYLTKKRLLSPEMLQQYSVGETADGEAYSFAYRWRPPGFPDSREKPQFEFCKVVKVERIDGKKQERRDPKGGKNILFGMEAACVRAARDARGALVICEGEIDAITWASYGFAAVSVPGGAKYLGWIEICWDWLEAFSKIMVSFDEDTAGREKVHEIVKRLGIARAEIIRLPLCEQEEETHAG